MLEDELTCEAIWEIVCRWHTMRVLFLLYCDSSIQASFSLSAISSWYDEEVEKDEEFAREMPLPVPSGTSCEASTRMSTAQRQRSYQRFYKAVMAHWVAVEMLWFAKVKFMNLLGSATKFSNMFGTCGLTPKNNGHFRKR